MLGVVAAVYDYDWKDAQRLFRLAMAHEPVSPPVREYYGYLYLLPMGGRRMPWRNCGRR